MNHNFKSGKRATSRLLGWLPREAKPLVHGIWRLASNKVQWHQSKVKQKRFTDPTFSHTTQCRNTLCKLWQPFRWNCVFHSCVATVILDMYRDVQITIYSHLMHGSSFASRIFCKSHTATGEWPQTPAPPMQCWAHIQHEPWNLERKSNYTSFCCHNSPRHRTSP